MFTTEPESLNLVAVSLLFLLATCVYPRVQIATQQCLEEGVNEALSIIKRVGHITIQQEDIRSSRGHKKLKCSATAITRGGKYVCHVTNTMSNTTTCVSRYLEKHGLMSIIAMCGGAVTAKTSTIYKHCIPYMTLHVLEHGLVHINSLISNADSIKHGVCVTPGHWTSYLI